MSTVNPVVSNLHLRIMVSLALTFAFLLSSYPAFAGQAITPQQGVLMQQIAQSMERQRQLGQDQNQEQKQNQGAIPSEVSMAPLPELSMDSEPLKPALPPYKKKIVTSAFNVDEPAQVADINDIARGFARELAERLQRSGKFLVRKADTFLGSGMRGDTPSLKMIRQMADANDSQLVVSGTIRSAEASVEKKYLGLWNTDQRDIEIDMVIYDGATGSQIAEHRVEKRVKKDVLVGREKSFGSKNFFSTSLGKAIDSMLDQLVEEVDVDLTDVPLSAKVLRVNNGQIILDAGASSAIAAGDVLAVYRLKNEMPITTAQQAVFGTTETRVGTVSIAQVQPLFSIGELSAEARASGIRAGDIVRAEPKLEARAQ